VKPSRKPNRTNPHYEWRPRVLIVHGDAEIRLALGVDLSGAFAVIEAPSLSDALRVVEAGEKLCAVVSGYRLDEEAGGVRLLTKVRAWLPEAARILVATAACLDEAPRALRSQLAHYVLGHPFGPGEAACALRQVLRDRGCGTQVDRRRSERLPATHIGTQVVTPGRGCRMALAVNLSRGGVLLDIGEEALPIADRLQVKLLVENQSPVALECDVLRISRLANGSTYQYQVAGAFRDLDQPAQRCLDVALASARTRQRSAGQRHPVAVAQ
jgi:hypothetical protein